MKFITRFLEKAKDGVLTFTVRGPWSETWTEYNEKLDLTTVFTEGRIIQETYKGVSKSDN